MRRQVRIWGGGGTGLQSEDLSGGDKVEGAGPAGRAGDSQYLIG